MRIHAVLEGSQDGRTWVTLAYEAPIPLALLAGWAYLRPALVYAAESGDQAQDVTPRLRQAQPPVPEPVEGPPRPP